MDELDALRRFRAPLAIADAVVRDRVAARIALPARAPSRSRPRMLLVIAVACALALAAVSGAASGVLSLVGVTDDPATSMPAAGSDPPSAYLLGNELHDAAGDVHRLSVAGSASTGSSDAIDSPSGQVVYEAGQLTLGAAPSHQVSLRLYDPASGTDSLLVPDALAPAWRHDGALAYATPQVGGDAAATVVFVRPTLTGAATAWTGSGRYEPLAWAGDQLIVARLGVDGTPTLLALSGPDRASELAHGALVAISPDGTHVVVSLGAALDGIPSSPSLRVIDVASGRVDGSFELPGTTPQPGGPGDWEGDEIVFPAPRGLVLLHATGDRLSLVRVVRFTGDSVLRGAEYHEARFADATGEHVVVKAIVVPAGGGTMLPSAVVCDVPSERCARGSVARDPREPLTLLFNPSKPPR